MAICCEDALGVAPVKTSQPLNSLKKLFANSQPREQFFKQIDRKIDKMCLALPSVYVMCYELLQWQLVLLYCCSGCSSQWT